MPRGKTATFHLPITETPHMQREASRVIGNLAEGQHYPSLPPSGFQLCENTNLRLIKPWLPVLCAFN